MLSFLQAACFGNPGLYGRWKFSHFAGRTNARDRVSKFWARGLHAKTNRLLSSLCVKAGLIARGFRFTDAVLEQGVG